MCGISGAVTTSTRLDVEALVERIAASQVCRGPDALVVRAFESPTHRIALGHNRLSIIDLRPEANQPMTIAGPRLHTVFNGEIYNYLELRAELEATGCVFTTRSDTEVVLRAYEAWGEAAFDRFIGMFALAIYDADALELLLVRDRFGVKPLYYWTDGASLVFASTATVIAQHANLKPNLDYVERGIRYKYYEDDTDISQYAGLRSLEPSHLLRLSLRESGIHVEKSRYYDLGSRASALREELAAESPAALEERLLALLRSATSLRQRSDVPIGLSVSGGIDSSTIAALLSENLPRVIGYSFARPDRSESEGPLVAELSKTTHLDMRWVWADGGDDAIRELFWKTLAAQDAPFANASTMAQFAVFRAARGDGTTVLLGGQGGDEAFMGYRKFYLFYAQSIVRERRLGALPHFVSAVIPFVPPVARRAGLFLSERKRYSGAAGGMGSRIVLPRTGSWQSMGMAKGETLAGRQTRDITCFSLPTLLRYEDRNSMGNSIESRLPFLDHRVIEFGIALPERHKLGNGFGKLILRRLLKNRVSDRIRLNRDKRGFDVSQRRWIEGGLGAELRAAITDRLPTIREFVPSGQSAAELFSDTRLATDPQTFKEAVSLIWLGDRL